MSCVDTISICFIRGDSWEQDVGLTAGYEEVIEHPEDFEGRLVLREWQDDNAPVLLTLVTTPEVDDVPSPVAPPHKIAYLRFTATPVQTQELPDWCSVVGYVELRSLSGSQVTRLFNAQVSIKD